MLKIYLNNLYFFAWRRLKIFKLIKIFFVLLLSFNALISAAVNESDYIDVLEKIGAAVTPSAAPTCFVCHADCDPQENDINFVTASLIIAGVRMTHDRPTIECFGRKIPVAKPLIDSVSVSDFMREGIQNSHYVLACYTPTFLSRLKQGVKAGEEVPSLQVEVNHILERLRDPKAYFLIGVLFDPQLKRDVPRELYDRFHRQIDPDDPLSLHKSILLVLTETIFSGNEYIKRCVQVFFEKCNVTSLPPAKQLAAAPEVEDLVQVRADIKAALMGMKDIEEYVCGADPTRLVRNDPTVPPKIASYIYPQDGAADLMRMPQKKH